MQKLSTRAEEKAKMAEALPAFSGLNLLHVRRQVAHFLSLIGREGIFDQYTVHDISHIDKMLGSLDWVVPDETRSVMSSADWLMITLATYFHDLGMLVTGREYDARASSDFPRYRDEVLFAGSNGVDYRAKVSALGPDRAERFLYQEWIRHKHADRIRAWIVGEQRTDLGAANEAYEEINALLLPLGSQFRRDLALICESHHLNDLNDLKKYKVSQPYGDSDAETANLQYSAVLLRTTDLLHITSDRTPSAVFKVINPTDPISQNEWAKQMAVKRLRSKIAVNEDGVLDDGAPRDTIEVHAYFTSDNGFFGLTSYLLYASQELKQSFDWISATRKANLAKHEFPWRRIDDTHIETEGFIRDSFEFTLDQAKILDLLTGHTLYNDTRVVLRELVQNAIDAIRLKSYPDLPWGVGRVSIIWDSNNRLLTVRDNGTGMTQREISSFLLRVGSSRYQDPEFKKKYPSFSSISRFGIGVLSTFMIADSVDITTCHPEEDQARRLTLRSVHGKYLIRLLGKADPIVQSVLPHGTELTLRIRPSVRLRDIVETAKLWVVLPGCEVSVQVDNGAPVYVGKNSISEALAANLAERGIAVDGARDNKAPLKSGGRNVVRVLSSKRDGLELAYAVSWNEYFREWEFLTVNRVLQQDDDPLVLGTCVEGIRVESQSPGFDGAIVVALANLSGPNAPKTNVARSGLESTTERDLMLREIYGAYRQHVADEAAELRSGRSFSQTWAAEEARYLLRPLFIHRGGERKVRPISRVLLSEQVAKLDVLPVEEGGHRTVISVEALSARSEFWTIESALLISAEPLIREAGTGASLGRVIAAIDIPKFVFPGALVLCGLRPTDWFGPFVYDGREVDQIIIHHDQRRIDFRWVKEASPSRWSKLSDRMCDLLREGWYRNVVNRSGSVREPWSLLVADDGVNVISDGGEIAVRVFDKIFILPNTPVAAYLRGWIHRAEAEASNEVEMCVAFIYDLFAQCSSFAGRINNSVGFVRQCLRRAEAEYLPSGLVERIVDMGGLTTLISETSWRTFDPLAWRRSSEQPVGFVNNSYV